MASAGEMRERITLIAPGSLDDWGQVAEGSRVEVWAAVESVKAEDRASGNAVLAESTLVATIRYRSGLTTAWKVQRGADTYAITAVQESGRQWLTLYLARR